MVGRYRGYAQENGTSSLTKPALTPVTRTDDRHRRFVLLSVSIVLHLLFLVLLWLSTNTRQPRRSGASESLLTLALPNAGAASSAPERKMPTPTPPVPTSKGPAPAAPADRPSDVPRTSAASGTQGVAGGCALSRDTAVAIGQDAAAMTELHALPPSARTSADAVLLWDGQWMDEGASSRGTAAGPLRRAVEQVVADAPQSCREAAAKGPEFIAVPDGARTVMIVIGSGEWRWADLLARPVPCPSAQDRDCVRSPKGSEPQAKSF